MSSLHVHVVHVVCIVYMYSITVSVIVNSLKQFCISIASDVLKSLLPGSVWLYYWVSLPVTLETGDKLHV